ncbi:MAG: dihydroorotate dehydrogenase B catalytic subunit [Candidatus Omnitrophica bacterium CG11_big_fil_rev_8_21_14_0_20_42_13]|uniref:Dihydroorotate dehydrogenase n=1 Tax=Candidatus Ghiorseimicrobium undicola TaxID=1974746 RepID=A0A2H0LVZ7_9BACT|nr:MAG: dihydroorotate dehydrogenase B catalytic subunit [Candidatus Omnitrophica bacterium CG11_big_fil_rev_8_21_14_0_20_42_13]
MNTEIFLGALRLKNPVLAASGTFGYGEEFKDFLKPKDIGAIVTKTITFSPRQGNLPPRITETAAGMLNSIGLENKGLDDFIKNKAPGFRKLKTPVIVSIAGDSPREYGELAKKLCAAGISAIELNLSCPNLKNSKLISQDPKTTYEVVKAVRKAAKAAIIAKLTPNVTDIREIAIAAEEAGADSVSLVNTFLGMGIDVNTRRPRLGNITGGLSGPAIKPIALRMVWETAGVVKIPVVGMGGIMTADEALEFIIAGASAVEIGTANFIEPKTSLNVVSGIKDYMRKNKIKDIKELIGSIRYK